MVHDSFAQWVETQVLPLQAANPAWLRLDGLDAGGNLNIVGRFWHVGRVWEVHGDTRFDPVVRAYEAMRDGRVSDPLVVKQARVRQCLVLTQELQRLQRPKHFYVYERIG